MCAFVPARACVYVVCVRVLCACVCAPGGYVWGDSGSAACAANSKAITSAKECARAAATMGKEWSADPTNTANRPSGCFWNERGTNVFFNTHVNGSGFPQRRLLCVVGASFVRLMRPW